MHRIIAVVLLIVSIGGLAQEDEKRKIDPEKIQFGGVYKNTVSLNVGGTSGIIGISWEHLLTKHLMMDIGIGYIGVGGGIQIYPWMVKRGKILPRLALSSTLMAWPKAAQFQSNYIGLGATWFLTRKFNLGLDLGPSYFYHYATSPKSFPDRWFLMGNFKFGYRFSFYAYKRRKHYMQIENEE